jgi:hypothetical protein
MIVLSKIKKNIDSKEFLTIKIPYYFIQPFSIWLIKATIKEKIKRGDA